MTTQTTELPEGWVWTTLDDLAQKLSSGGTPSRKNPSYWGGDIPFVKIEDITAAGRKVRSTSSTITPIGLEESPAWLVPSGSVLYTIYGSYGIPAILEIEAATNQAIMAFLPASEEVNVEYVYHFLKSKQGNLDSLTKGTTQKNLSAGIVRSLPVPLAPSAEQRRIVDALEAHFADLDAGVEALEAARRDLGRYRRSVLRAAVEGALTSDWRRRQPSAGDASALLARILEERRERWEAEQLQKYEAKGKTPPKNWRQRYKPPAEPETDGLPELPPGWVWTNLDQLKVFSLYGPRFSSSDYSETGYSVLRTTDISDNGRVDTSSTPKLQLDPEAFAKYRVDRGDLLITRTGSIGTFAVFDDEVEAIPGAYLIQYRLVRATGLPDWVALFLRSPAGQNALKGGSAGIGRPNLNAPTIESIPIPLPPLAEQAAIVEAVDEKLSVAEAVAAEVDRQLARAERLRRSLLARAFAGRLVPQDPADEPASALLARLRGEPPAEATPADAGRQRVGVQGALNFSG